MHLSNEYNDYKSKTWNRNIGKGTNSEIWTSSNYEQEWEFELNMKIFETDIKKK